MNTSNVAILVLYALGMSIGQVLFKVSADRSKVNSGTAFLGAIVGDGYFWLAVIVYCALTLLWVWILTRVPLSRAYPFAVLAFVFTPAFASLLFDESLDSWYLLGVGFILLGLGVLIWKAN